MSGPDKKAETTTAADADGASSSSYWDAGCLRHTGPNPSTIQRAGGRKRGCYLLGISSDCFTNNSHKSLEEACCLQPFKSAGTSTRPSLPFWSQTRLNQSLVVQTLVLEQARFTELKKKKRKIFTVCTRPSTLEN